MLAAERRRLLGQTRLIIDLGPDRRGRPYPRALTSVALLVPAAAVLGAFVAWPVVRIAVASVTDGGGSFVGLRHFRAALGQEGAWAVIGRTLLWGAVVPAVVTSLGFALAIVSRRGRTGRLATFVLVAPIALPLVVTGIVFRLLYDPDPTRGPVSGTIGASFLSPGLITLALMSAFVWAWVGLALVVFRTALDRVRPELADVVVVLGGSRRDVFLDGVWRPVLRRTFAIVFALVALATVRSFDLILVMAPGSVLDEASVLGVLQWQTSAGTTTGPSAALGVTWLVIVILGVTGAAWWSRQKWPPPLLEDVAGGAVPLGPAGTTGLAALAVPVPLPAAATSAPSRSESLRTSGRRAVLVAATLLWLAPLVVLLGTSWQSPRDAAVSGWWHRPLSLESFREVLGGDELTRSLVLTGALAVGVAVTVTSIALLAASALAWTPSMPAHLAGFALLGAAVVPIQVIADPIDEVLRTLHLTDTSIGLGLVHVALGLPFAVLLLRNALSDVELERLRQARLAGRREWEVVWNLAPSVVTTTIAVFVLEFVQVWNDLVVGLLFGGPNAAPLGVALHGQSRQFVSNSGPVAASAVVAAVVPLLLVLLVRRRIVSGLVSGALR